MDKDIRSDMEAAFDKLENETPEEVAEEVVEEVVEETAEDVEESPKEVTKKPEVTASEPNELKQEVSQKKDKAPVDWSPTLREHWGKLPAEVREKISARERDIAITMQETSAARHLANGFIQTIEPYRALMAAEGVQNPLDAVSGLMRVTSILAMGAPQQKAERIAGLVKHYGVDIELLDQALAGSLPKDPQQDAFQKMLDERMAPFNQLLSRFSQAEQQRDEQLYGQSLQTIEQFGADPKNEFFEHVRYRMADFLDMATQNGQQLSLKQAYDMACAMNPEIQQVLAQRKPVSLEDKRRASSSLASRGTDTSKGGDRTLREEIEAQFSDDARIA